MSSSLNVFIQYFLLFSLTIALVWFSLLGLDVGTTENKWDYIKATWESANKGWLLLVAVAALVSHIIRAERWRMLLAPSGYPTKLNHSFYSLMVGYLVNLVVPRGGEVSRCYNLYKLNNAPVEKSFGTVVVERIIDVICLLILVVISFLLESKKLFAFLQTLSFASSSGTTKVKIIVYVLLIGFALMTLSFFVLRRNQKIKSFFQRTWSGFREGLLSIFKLKNKGLFIVYSILIWLLYFLMSYTIIKAFPSTSLLGWDAVLSLFAIGAIAMAAPLPGGTGSYHVLVPQGLVFLYHIPRSEAVAFTFIFHGWQTLIMILGGAISLLVTSYIIRKKSRHR